MDTVTVYGMRASGNCFKVALILAHLDQPHRWVEVNSYTSNIDGVAAVGALLTEAFALPSLTETSIRVSMRRAWAVTCPPSGVNLMALLSRFQRICCRRLGSPFTRKSDAASVASI